MDPLVIRIWAWDEENLAHMWERHRLRRRQVEEVARNAPKFRANRVARAATHQMIGPDAGGRVWVVCMYELRESPGCWRVVIGWPADKGEIDWYNEGKPSKGESDV